MAKLEVKSMRNMILGQEKQKIMRVGWASIYLERRETSWIDGWTKNREFVFSPVWSLSSPSLSLAQAGEVTGKEGPLRRKVGKTWCQIPQAGASCPAVSQC